MEAPTHPTKEIGTLEEIKQEMRRERAKGANLDFDGAGGRILILELVSSRLKLPPFD